MNSAAPSAQSGAIAGLAPYFRRYELPWSPSEEMERRFRSIFRSLAILFTVIAVIIPFLPTPERVANTESLPERVVQLVIEPPKPPPPPPIPPPKPAEKAPVAQKPSPVVPKPVDPRKKASKSGLLAFQDQLADLRNAVDVDTFSKNQAKSDTPGDVSIVQRSIIASKAGGTSGGIATSSISSGLAAGSGALHGISTAQVKDPTLGAGNRAARAGGSGKASRSAEEVALVFDRNKGAIDAMYARALRDNPAMQGKVVLEITIAPSGEVTAARIVASDLKDAEFERKLIARVRLYRFAAKDVAVMVTTKPIDFFPQ